MGIFDLVKRALGKESDDGSQAVRDEQLACLYEACSNGTLAIINDPPVILKRGETAHFVSPVSVIEQKTETTTYRAYAGTRLKIGSLPIYLGGSAPKKVSNEALTPMGDGWLVITNRRIVVSGTKVNYSTSLDKITNWKLFTDAIQIMWEGRYGGRFYRVNDPRVPALILQTLITGVPSPESVGLHSGILSVNPGDFVYAASEGQEDFVIGQLDKGTDINTQEELGFTALIAAASNGHSHLVSHLLDRGADPDIKTDLGYTALMFAALDGYSETVKLLLGAGAKINLKNKEGATALMLAASNGHYESVEILLQSGANPNNKTKEGVTALDVALHGEHSEVAEILKAYGAKG